MSKRFTADQFAECAQYKQDLDELKFVWCNGMRDGSVGERERSNALNALIQRQLAGKVARGERLEPETFKEKFSRHMLSFRIVGDMDNESFLMMLKRSAEIKSPSERTRRTQKSFFLQSLVDVGLAHLERRQLFPSRCVGSRRSEVHPHGGHRSFNDWVRCSGVCIPQR